MSTSQNQTARPSSKGGWAVLGLLIFGAIVLAGFLAAVRPPGGALLAVAVIGGAVALLAKRDWQDKAFGPLGINASPKRYLVLGVTIVFMLVTFGSSDSEDANAPVAGDGDTGNHQVAEKPEGGLPEYEMIDQMKRVDGVMHGDVLVPSYTWETPVADRERTAKSISAEEGFDDLFLYSTRDAYKAAYSDSFKKEHPEASAGYLGRWRDGKFTPNTESPASGIAKNGAGNSLPSRWLNETYNATVRRVGDKSWEEVENKTGRVTWRYTETGRTKDYTEIFDAKRKYEVRLFSGRMELKKDGKWIRVAKGHWDDAPENPNAGFPKQN